MNRGDRSQPRRAGGKPVGRWFAGVVCGDRRALIRLGIMLLGLSILQACSAPTRYRVLSFFFDGVPTPGTGTAADEASEGTEVAALPSDGSGPLAAAPVRTPSYAHPPFRDNRCDECHNITTRQPSKTVSEGLCQTCHNDLPGRARFVHGPVAVNACLFCHHHHSAPHPKVLLDEPPALCLRCHDENDLAGGEYHATIGEQVCVECHDPHTGDNRFFLKEAQR